MCDENLVIWKLVYVEHPPIICLRDFKMEFIYSLNELYVFYQLMSNE